MQRKSAMWLCAIFLTVTPGASRRVFSEVLPPPGEVALSGASPEQAARLSGEMRSKPIRAAMRKVADAELPHIQAQPMSRTWEAATRDLGLLAATRTLGDAKYAKYVGTVCDHFGWRIEHTIYPANDYAMAQVMIEISRGDARTLDALRMRLDGDLRDPFDPANPLWKTADALFFEPPAAMQMSAITSDPTYAVFVNREWHRTARLLYDPQKHLYAQDQRALALPEKNRFSARANGMALAGLVRVLAALDSEDPLRPAYIGQVRELSSALLAAQNADGLWRASLLDSTTPPDAASSALIVYALAWSLNHHHLDARSLPAIERSWAGLVAQINANGEFAQNAISSGASAFLLAGSEVDALSQHKRW